jgi:hypothetical protein
MEQLNNLPEMNLKGLTTLNFSPKTVNVGSVNFNTNLFMNNTHNKNNPLDKVAPQSTWVDSLMSLVTQPSSLSTNTNANTNSSKLSNLSTSSSFPSSFYSGNTYKDWNCPNVDTGVLKRSTYLDDLLWNQMYGSTGTHVTNTYNTGSTGTYTFGSTGSNMYQSTGTYELKSQSLLHDYNVLNHIFKLVESVNNDNPYTVTCSCMNLSVSDNNTQSTGAQSSTSSTSSVDTNNHSTTSTEASTEVPTEVQTEVPTEVPTEASTEVPTEVSTEASASVTVEDENTNEEN